MIVLAPYILSMTVYTVDSGHLDLDATVSIADGRVDAEDKSLLRELHMEQTSQELAEHAAAEVGISIEKTLDMLRSKHGNVSLDVPIFGSLTDCRIGLEDVIGKAPGSAFESATIEYLTYVNPAYSIGVSVLQEVKKKIEKIRVGRLNTMWAKQNFRQPRGRCW